MGVYNGEQGLSETIESVLSQEGVGLEFIIVDDGSTDSSSSILENCAAQDPRIRIFRQDNQGLTRALIRGCREARGVFIGRQDVGDVSFSSRFRKQAALLKSKEEGVVVGSGYELIAPRGELMFKKIPECSSGDATAGLLSGKDGAFVAPCHAMAMFRRDAYEAVGGYRKNFFYAQDLDLWTRMADKGSITFVPEVLGQVRYSYGSVSTVQDRTQKRLRKYVLEATRARKRGDGESTVLAKASKVRAERGNKSMKARARAAYFVGSCLAVRGDPAARSYFVDSLQANPFMLRSWVKLLKEMF
jgi:glycosyltransferase involved in cell wall biosynthesis